MGNIKLTIAIMLKSILAMCFYGYSLSVVADTSVAAEPSASRHKVELIRDQDYKCVQCHKDAKQTLQSSHGATAHAELGREVNCTDCHGTISQQHRNGAPEVNKFSSSQSQAGSDKQQLSQEHILTANQQCTECHKPHELREYSWTHDVHAKNLTCSNCHELHGEDKKVLGFDKKQTMKLCVECHSDFNANKASQEE